MKVREIKFLNKKIFFLVVCMFSLVLFTANVSAASLVAYYSFDDGTATDNSGNGNNGVIYGATSVNGKVGKAFQFDGINDYIATGKGLGASSAITVEAWIKHNSTTGEQNIVSRNSGYRFRTTNGVLEGMVENAAGTFSNPQSGTLKLASNTWYHVVMVYSGSTIKTYIDGVEDDSVNYSGALKAGTLLEIGAIPVGGAMNFFNGAIDEVKIYDYARTGQQICEEAGEYWDGANCIIGCNPGDTRQCGTTNIGACEYGTETCQGDRTWGSCAGYIDPVTEVCGNSLDDDCDNSIDEGCPSCIGCFLNAKCLPVGIRANNTVDSYCDMDYQWKTIKADGTSCYNDFECAGNDCSDNVCKDIHEMTTENKSLIEQILCLLGVSSFC